MSHALSDIRILDFTRAAAGPSCTRMLAEMGAEVIKIEGAPSGDFVRGMSACTWRNDRSLYFVQQNRGKKSVCVNLKNPRGLALVAEFVPHVDAVVENFRPGVMEGLGFSYERLKEMKEDIILCSITGFGQKGPLSTKPGYDFIAQAYAGITSMIGEPDEPPYLPMTSMGDISTGVHGALAVVSAIHHRDRTGAGDHLDVALLDAYYHYHDANVHTYSASGGEKNPTRSGRHFDYLCPCGIFRANGGSVVIMAFPPPLAGLVSGDGARRPDHRSTLRRRRRPPLAPQRSGHTRRELAAKLRRRRACRGTHGRQRRSVRPGSLGRRDHRASASPGAGDDP